MLLKSLKWYIQSVRGCAIITSYISIYECIYFQLSHVDGDEKDNGVCATCVVRLRDACAFRRQVLQCEELFLSAKLDDKDGKF